VFDKKGDKKIGLIAFYVVSLYCPTLLFYYLIARKTRKYKTFSIIFQKPIAITTKSGIIINVRERKTLPKNFKL
jgi:hypothetical protein